jgi:L-asparaginase
MQSTAHRIVILGTGGTIAGTATSAQDNLGYRAAQLGVDALVAAVPALRGLPLQADQVAQVDSKDMSWAIWQQLAQRVAALLQQADVAGVVITHGTDTLEETAYFLHRVLAPSKPVVLTAAMRPATSAQADGPQNLLDAVTLARHPGARGVLVVMAGTVFSGADIRKTDTQSVDAFVAGEGGALGRISDGQVQLTQPWPEAEALGLAVINSDPASWPRVEIVMNYAGADGRIVDALVGQGVHGLVLAGTGNGTLSSSLEASALRAQALGVHVRRASRCAGGAVVGGSQALVAAGRLSAVQARVALLLQLLQQRQR